MGDVVVNNSPTWFPTLEAIQLANWCDAAAVALVCYDSVLMFPREVKYIWQRQWSFMSTFYVMVRYLGISLALGFWAFNANISMSPSMWDLSSARNSACHSDIRVGVAIDRFINFGAFVDTIVGDAIMSMRIYAMYLGSKIVLVLLVVMMLARIALGLAVAIVVFGPNSGISATELVLSGIYVCGPDVDTASSLPFVWDVLGIVVNALLFLLAAGCFLKHALDTHRTLGRWKVSDLMGVLVRDSIIYFALNLLATILLMISVWGIPDDSTYFAIITAYTQNESSVLIPRLVISFRETYAHDGQPSQHGGGGGRDRGRDGDGGDAAGRRAIRSGEGMVFAQRRTVTTTGDNDNDINIELRTVHREDAEVPA